MSGHLWEVHHPYYCNDGNYYSNEAYHEWKSWDEFFAEFGDSDLDYNAIFRFDWRDGEDWGATDYNGDDYYRNGHLHIYWVGQRKGLFHVSVIDVCRADEPAVIAFLRPRFEYLMALWSPLSTAEQEPAHG
ncbi:hypothetical protein GCM10011390_42070 [Aureimonas endophytica]|uniref:Uncharacterized protein n=1 Tax=Aureimonas endophytica TaxID=2027858 RepID=A0A917EA51_9HYPH|nr:hypothetical protein [Aureimonas endophytica]GGE18472.1 hypothetical protein GCM10011390_42070 [Aureimonas endophytica]